METNLQDLSESRAPYHIVADSVLIGNSTRFTLSAVRNNAPQLMKLEMKINVHENLTLNLSEFRVAR